MNHSIPRPLRTWRRLPRRTARPGVLTRNAVLHSSRARRALARSARFALIPFATCGLLATGITALRADTVAPTTPEVTASTPEPSKIAPADVTHATLNETSKPTPSTDVTTADAKAAAPKSKIQNPKSVMRATRLSRFRMIGQDPTPQNPTAPPTAAPQTPPAPAPETQPAPTPATTPAPGTVSYSGLVDLYYGINMRAPRSGYYQLVTPSGEVLKSDNAGMFFNVNDREPSLSLGELNISRTQGGGFPLGVTATLTFGDSARFFHATEPGGTSSWQTLHNLYVSRTFSLGKRDLEVDFGKFASPFGYEVLESSNNDNYSRAFNFFYGVPFYHLGFRALGSLNNRISFQVGAVNGWNDAADDNDQKSFYFQTVLKPNPRFTGILSYITGTEGTGAYGSLVRPGDGSIDTNVFDGQAIYQVNDKLKIAGWVTYGDGAGTVLGQGASGHWLGLVAYARYQITPKAAAALRVEQFEDYPGNGSSVLGSGLRFGLGYLKMREFTLTGEYSFFRNHLLARLEYRHDISSTPFFGNGASGTTGDQDTLYASGVIKF